MTTYTRPTAQQINQHLERGGMVVVATYARATTYGPKHAGYFSEGKDGALYVQQGRGRVCLSVGERLIVGLRLCRTQ